MKTQLTKPAREPFESPAAPSPALRPLPMSALRRLVIGHAFLHGNARNGAADQAIVTASALRAVAHKPRQLHSWRETSASSFAFHFHSPRLVCREPGPSMI
jgi:hypothetical protein